MWGEVAWPSTRVHQLLWGLRGLKGGGWTSGAQLLKVGEGGHLMDDAAAHMSLPAKIRAVCFAPTNGHNDVLFLAKSLPTIAYTPLRCPTTLSPQGRNMPPSSPHATAVSWRSFNSQQVAAPLLRGPPSGQTALCQNPTTVAWRAVDWRQRHTLETMTNQIWEQEVISCCPAADKHLLYWLQSRFIWYINK